MQYSFSIYTFIAVLIHGVFILSCRVHSSYICMQQLWRLRIIPVYKNVFWISKNIKILYFLNVKFVVEGKVLTSIRFSICMYIVDLDTFIAANKCHTSTPTFYSCMQFLSWHYQEIKRSFYFIIIFAKSLLDFVHILMAWQLAVERNWTHI